MENTIVIRHLSKSYGGVPAVSDLSLTVGRGEVFGLLGANGAGKSTAIECALGTRKADSGSVRILGLDPRAPRTLDGGALSRTKSRWRKCRLPPAVILMLVSKWIGSLARKFCLWRESARPLTV